MEPEGSNELNVSKPVKS